MTGLYSNNSKYTNNQKDLILETQLNENEVLNKLKDKDKNNSQLDKDMSLFPINRLMSFITHKNFNGEEVMAKWMNIINEVTEWEDWKAFIKVFDFNAMSDMKSKIKRFVNCERNGIGLSKSEKKELKLIPDSLLSLFHFKNSPRMIDNENVDDEIAASKFDNLVEELIFTFVFIARDKENALNKLKKTILQSSVKNKKQILKSITEASEAVFLSFDLVHNKIKNILLNTLSDAPLCSFSEKYFDNVSKFLEAAINLKTYVSDFTLSSILSFGLVVVPNSLYSIDLATQLIPNKIAFQQSFRGSAFYRFVNPHFERTQRKLLIFSGDPAGSILEFNQNICKKLEFINKHHEIVFDNELLSFLKNDFTDFNLHREYSKEINMKIFRIMKNLEKKVTVFSPFINNKSIKEDKNMESVKKISPNNKKLISLILQEARMNKTDFTFNLYKSFQEINNNTDNSDKMELSMMNGEFDKYIEFLSDEFLASKSMDSLQFNYKDKEINEKSYKIAIQNYVKTFILENFIEIIILNLLIKKKIILDDILCN